MSNNTFSFRSIYFPGVTSGEASIDGACLTGRNTIPAAVKAL